MGPKKSAHAPGTNPAPIAQDPPNKQSYRAVTIFNKALKFVFVFFFLTDLSKLTILDILQAPVIVLWHFPVCFTTELHA